jgi:hypothetical protein
MMTDRYIPRNQSEGGVSRETLEASIDPDAELDDMGFIAGGERQAPKAGDVVYVKRGDGSIDVWKLTDRRMGSGNPAVESTEPILIPGETEPKVVERGVSPDSLTLEGQDALHEQFLAQEAAKERAAAEAEVAAAYASVDSAPPIPPAQKDPIDLMRVRNIQTVDAQGPPPSRRERLAKYWNS